MIRFFDILFSLVGLVILLPLMLILYLLIVLESRGGGFYIQKRVGKNGIDFKLLKFRSMRPGSDKKGLITLGAKDSRMTGIGYFIRRFKLDELPQLFNVLRGDLSLVGPRALIPRELSVYEKRHTILSVKSGLTGLAQVSGRKDISFDERRKLDLYYVQNWTFWSDIIILLKTLRTVIGGSGAK